MKKFDLHSFAGSVFPWAAFFLNVVVTLLFCVSCEAFFHYQSPALTGLLAASIAVLFGMCGMSMFKDPIRCENRGYNGIGKFLFYFIGQAAITAMMIAALIIYRIWAGTAVVSVLFAAEIAAAVYIVIKYRYSF